MSFVPGGMESDSDDDEIYFGYSSKVKKSSKPPPLPQEPTTEHSVPNGGGGDPTDQKDSENNNDSKPGFPTREYEPFDWSAPPPQNDAQQEEENLSVEEAKPEEQPPQSFFATYMTTQRTCTGVWSALMSIELEDLEPLFYEQGITDIKQYQTLDEEDLIRIGIKRWADREKILDHIRFINGDQWRKSSIPRLGGSKDRDLVDCDAAIRIVADVAKHINFMDATLAYLEERIHKRPDMLEYGILKGQTSVQELRDAVRLVQKNNDTLRDRSKHFAARLSLLLEDSRFVQPDVIPPTECTRPVTNYWINCLAPKRKRGKRKFFFILLAGILLTASSAYYLKDCMFSGRCGPPDEVLIDLSTGPQQ